MRATTHFLKYSEIIKIARDMAVQKWSFFRKNAQNGETMVQSAALDG